jgi:phosphatidylglycerol---prolipoprotein diacylglyceryl transferase
MRRIFFRWRGRTVWSYPAMLYIGLLFGVFASQLAAKDAGLDSLRVYAATMILIVPALIGARLLYVAAKWDTYRCQPRRIWDRREGGFMMFGAVPVMLLCSVPLLPRLRLTFGSFWDVSVFTILVGMIFTRLGCLLNGCCSGRASKSWIGVYLPNHMGVWKKRIPSQMLEAACAAGLLALAVAIRRQLPFPGALFLVMVLGYSAVRFGMEFLRQRDPNDALLSVGHRAAAIAFLASIAILSAGWPR